jgi:alkylation response protein AidB-like acyl-CoA dehydrogenase
MQASLDLTVAYLSDRHQFGRPLGSFQALQHRLAELHIDVEGARWLTRQAAWEGDADEPAALACTAATDAAERTIGETHQLTGAMGLTKEYDLHLWTMRLVALSQEGGGGNRHAEDSARPASAAVAGRTSDEGK